MARSRQSPGLPELPGLPARPEARFFYGWLVTESAESACSCCSVSRHRHSSLIMLAGHISVKLWLPKFVVPL